MSKNGNLLLSVPQPGDGSIDAEEEKVLDGMEAWMGVNGEAVFGSRPWRSYGEGPTRLMPGMQNEQSASAFTARGLHVILFPTPPGFVPVLRIEGCAIA